MPARLDRHYGGDLPARAPLGGGLPHEAPPASAHLDRRGEQRPESPPEPPPAPAPRSTVDL
ncbi:hypothetical protein [Amycolatopsis sp. NPDC003861]